MSVRTVQTTFTSSATAAAATTVMTAVPNILTAVDLNAVHPPPGLASESVLLSLTKGPSGRARSYSGSHSNGSMNANNSRNFNRPGNKRYPQGMRLPSSSYNQTQNQFRRTSFSQKSNASAGTVLSTPLYQRTSRFDPFGDARETVLSPPIITSPSSQTSPPIYTHFYYYDSTTNRPTLAYADDKSPVNPTTITASTNILLDTLLNGGRRDAPSTAAKQTTFLPAESQTQSRPPSPPQSTRPRATAISRPNSPPATAAASAPSKSATAVVVSSPAPPIKVPKAQRDAIARVVASMLLNRTDGPGRRGRRCSQPYVKSSLSRVVFVE